MSTIYTPSVSLNVVARKGPAPIVGLQPPQLQYSDTSPRDIFTHLKSWAFGTFPNVREHDTLISVPSSRALWLDESILAAHADAFMPPPHSREFAHIHLDGSMHLIVDREVENEILQKSWGIRHMYYHQGIKEMLVYAPRDKDELATVQQFLTHSYYYASGNNTFIPCAHCAEQ